MTTRCVLYLPVVGRRADRYEFEARRWAAATGNRLVKVTDDPAEVRRLIEAGHADTAVVVAQAHRHALTGLPVLDLPRQRAGEAWAGAGLLGLGVWLADRWRDHQAAAGVAAVSAASAAVLVLAVATMEGPARPESAAPPPTPAAPGPAPPPAPWSAPPAVPVAPLTSSPSLVTPSLPPIELPSSRPPPSDSSPRPSPVTPTTTPTATIPEPPASTPPPTAPGPVESVDQRCLVDLQVGRLTLAVCIDHPSS